MARASEAFEFDVFLSYNREDRQEVEHLAADLKDRGLRVFKDDWYLKPGEFWPRALERKLRTSASIVIICGGSGLGPWQQREAVAALDRQDEAEKAGDPVPPVIPLLLEKGGDLQAGLLFLRQNVWVEAWDPRAADLIAGAIRSKAPTELYDDDHKDPRRLVCPYRGLGVFREEDASFFFGRDDDAENLRIAVERYPFVAVVGPSGSGKSSLVRAGLFSTLRRQKGDRIWQLVAMTPGRNPFLSLAYELLPLREPKRYPGWTKLDIDDYAFRLKEHLEEQGASYLLRIVEDILKEERGTTHLLMLIDQWEELYTYQPSSGANVSAYDERKQRFINMLAEAVRSSSFRAVFTLRADFWGNVLNEQALMDCSIREATVHLGAMDRNSLQKVILGPAKVVGLDIEAGLPEILLRDAAGQPGDMPLLEFTLQRLWTERDQGRRDKLTVDAYNKLGGLNKAIVNLADQLYDQLTQSERDAVPSLFSALVQVDEQHSDLRRRARLGEFSKPARAVARQFADRRLLVTSRDDQTGEDLVEVAHEALLRHWPNLKHWIDDRRNALLIRRQLEADVSTWLERGRKDSFLWSHERVREAAIAVEELGSDLTLSDDERAFLGPIDPPAMLRALHQPETTHRERALLGERLDMFGDPRDGTGLTPDGIPDISWSRIDGGDTTVEVRSDPNNLHSAVADSLPRTSVSFSMSRYPITTAQYRAFLDAEDGWTNHEWWSDQLYRDPEGNSYNFGSFGNHPVVYINWFDALAFCRWLSQRMGKTISLPDEWQWQLAASGGDVDRIYPWGRNWNPQQEPSRANTFESKLGGMTAVGMYPDGASSDGVLDMSGTVWEWTLNKFEKPEITESSASDFDLRVLRGGSWTRSQEGARCAGRYWNFPVNRYYDVGIRVVCSSPTEDY